MNFKEKKGKYDMEKNLNICLKAIICAAKTLINNDSDRHCLLEKTGMERSVQFVFAYYIKKLININRIDVDCEYNKNLEDIKRIGIQCHDCFYEDDCYYRRNMNSSKKNKKIVPDILIHRRQSTMDDFIVIEIKHHKNLYSLGHPAFKNDFQKLSYMTCIHSEYKYQLGLEIIFTRDNVYFLMFKNGKMLFDRFKSLKEMENFIKEGEYFEKY